MSEARNPSHHEASPRRIRIGLDTYGGAIKALPAGTMTRQQLLTDEFRLGREGNLSIFYAPVEGIEKRARIVLVGLTPGWQQMRLAFEACRDALLNGLADSEALAAVKAAAAFAGMRRRIALWLDDLGVASWLGLVSTSKLFDDRRDLLHTTSAIRYPVFVGDDYRNYTGHAPRPEHSPMLMNVVAERLGPELAEFPETLVVPMGNVVSDLMQTLADVGPARCSSASRTRQARTDTLLGSSRESVKPCKAKC